MRVSTVFLWVAVALNAAAAVPALAGPPAAATSQPAILDVLILGDPQSEQDHQFGDELSEVVRGGLEQSARRLRPREPAAFDGGSIHFTVNVDPQRQNYLTVKFWGSDKGEERGRLMLFSGDQQIGYRSEGDYDVLNNTENEGIAPGQFVYQTAILPLSLTRGKTHLPLTVRSFGPIWWYGQTFAQFQKNLTAPTRGVYRVYTHTNARFDPPATEAQGKLQVRGVRPSPGEEVIDQSKRTVIDRLNHLLAATVSNPDAAGGKVREGRLALMSQAYRVAWTPAYKNPKTLDQIVRDGDDWVAAAAADPKAYTGSWVGLGPVGAAMMRVWPDLQDRMSETVSLGVPDARNRGEAWAAMLRKGIDYWRTNRRGYTNQSMIVDANIYYANRGIRLLDPRLALPEEQALRYVYEAVGLTPWHGSDVPASERAGPSTKPDSNEWSWVFNDAYFDVTRKGLSREVGYVGTYGETILTFLREMVDLTGDAKLREQLRKIATTRLVFRYPGVDRDGYCCMKLVSEIDNRSAHYPRSGSDYNAADISESWWMEVPALLSDDAALVGAAQQALSDNQYFDYVGSRLKDQGTAGMMRNVDEYAKVKALPPTGRPLPMTDGQPDFVFSDEEDAVVAVKHGDTRLFVNLFYRSFFGINGVARVLETGPDVMRLASVKSEFEVRSVVGTYTRPNYLHWQYDETPARLPPPPLPRQALAGDVMPVAAPPKGVTPLKPPAWGPFAGKADFYQLRYGDYLIAMNTTYDGTFELTVPDDAPAGARDLVTAKSVRPGERISVAPLTTAVVYLGR